MSQILRVATRFIPNCEEWFWDGLNGSFVEGIKKSPIRIVGDFRVS
jgi:hypothetical protein